MEEVKLEILSKMECNLITLAVYMSKSQRGFFVQVVWPNFLNSDNEVHCALNFRMGLCQKCHIGCCVLVGSMDERLLTTAFVEISYWLDMSYHTCMCICETVYRDCFVISVFCFFSMYNC